MSKIKKSKLRLRMGFADGYLVDAETKIILHTIGRSGNNMEVGGTFHGNVESLWDFEQFKREMNAEQYPTDKQMYDYIILNFEDD